MLKLRCVRTIIETIMDVYSGARLTGQPMASKEELWKITISEFTGASNMAKEVLGNALEKLFLDDLKNLKDNQDEALSLIDRLLKEIEEDQKIVDNCDEVSVRTRKRKAQARNN